MASRKKRKQQKRQPQTQIPRAPTARAEHDVFSDLERLCQSPGFIHTVAYFCFRDNTVGYADELTVEDLLPRYSHDRLIRNEISTLMGLMVKAPIDFAIPAPERMEKYIEEADALLRELHVAMERPWGDALNSVALGKIQDPFGSAQALREPMFYSAESAYSFQYRDLAPRKYAFDREWLVANKAIDITVADAVLRAVAAHIDGLHLSHPLSLLEVPPDEWTALPAFRLVPKDIASASGVSESEIDAFLSAFTYAAGQNATFTSLSDYNAVNAYPILRDPDGAYLVLQYQALAEALYDTPFYWMGADKAYAPVALKNRGEFAEDFSEERLKRVFGEGFVFRGVNLVEAKGKVTCEIDTLVVFGDRAIVLQAKAKRLTIEARKGNDPQLKDDFKKAVQDAATQAHLCADILVAQTHKLVAADGTEVSLPFPLKRIFPVCIVADHYPALAFQARQFLKDHVTEVIAPTLVTDVFAVDAMTEFLETPLRLLSYLELRARFGASLIASHELTLLSYHLKRNLWLDGQFTVMSLGDDIAADLDLAMAVRRDGVPGSQTPEGILTRFGGTHFDRLVTAIEGNAHPSSVAFGLLLMELSETTIERINQGITSIAGALADDENVRDFSCNFTSSKSGLTVHCTGAEDRTAKMRLEAHCAARKYITRSDTWIGVLLAPDAELRGILKFEWPWAYDEEQDAATADMRRAAVARAGKTGRNQQCSCGSGLKFKKCCLNRRP